MLRELLKQAIDKVQRGIDPLGVLRDRHHPMIDTNLTKSIAMHYSTGIATPTAAADKGRNAADDR